MILQLKSWIVTLCTTIFFITAVEMILPDNSLKKYARFVLGLILISVLINPIIKLFDKNYDMQVSANNIAKEFEQDEYKKSVDVYKNKSIESTLGNFKSNLEKLCIEKLKEKYPLMSFKVEADVLYNNKKEKFEIENINVGVNDGKVDKVKKVEIHLKPNDVIKNKQIDEQTESDIKDYLSSLLRIPKKCIFIYKL